MPRAYHLKLRFYLLFMAFVLLGIGCAAKVESPSGPPVVSEAGLPASVTLSALRVEDVEVGQQVVLDGSSPYSFGFETQDQPFRLTIDIPLAQIDGPRELTVNNGGLQSVSLQEKPGDASTARLELRLNEGALYNVAKDGDRLLVRVRLPQAAGDRASSQSYATVLTQTPVGQPLPAPGATSAVPAAIPQGVLDYRVGPGDILSVTVYGEPELTQTYRVSDRGNLTFPLIGSQPALGLTTDAIAAQLARRLSPKYVVNPQITVEVAEYKSQKVFVVGAVQPATFTLRGDTTLLEILSQVEGLENNDHLMVFRRLNDRDVASRDNAKQTTSIRVDLNQLLRQGDMSLNMVLKPRDVIYVPKPPPEPENVATAPNTFVVFGEVKAPGTIELPESGLSVFGAIVKAGGFAQWAAPSRTRVLRMVDGKEETIKVDLAAVIRGQLSKDIPLQPNDIIIVPERSLF